MENILKINDAPILVNGIKKSGFFW